MVGTGWDGTASSISIVSIGKTMRLLIASSSSDRGGVEEYALTIASAAVREGWEVYAAFSQSKETASLIQDFSKNGVHYYPLKLYPTNAGLLERSNHALLRLTQAISLLSQIKPDAVMVNLASPVQCLDIIIACGLFKIPTIVVFHSIAFRFSFSSYKLKLYDWARAKNQQWIAVSENNRKLVCESFQVPPEQMLCIYNGVKLPSTSVNWSDADITQLRHEVRQEFGLPGNSRLALTVGRLDLEKGYGDLIPIIPQIVKEFPEVRFIWVGDGEQREYLTKKVLEYGVGDRILFLGYRRDVPRLLKSADLFVFPTHYEGLPFALLEAMAYNLPVVTSDADAIVELVEHQLHCLIFRRSDRNDLLKNLSWALNNRDRMQKFAENAHVLVQDFSEARMIEETLEVLQKMQIIS
jgi:glycosyltransferase involved in cell wall biosynthesis